MKKVTRNRIIFFVWLACYIAILVYTIAFADFGDFIDPLIFFGIPIFSLLLIPTKPGEIKPDNDPREQRSTHPIIRMIQNDNTLFKD